MIKIRCGVGPVPACKIRIEYTFAMLQIDKRTRNGIEIKTNFAVACAYQEFLEIPVRKNVKNKKAKDQKRQQA